MENLRKVISLHQASVISGYHQDYLSSLIRKNEIKGEKLGGSWFTTEEEIQNYIFKQKIKNKNWLLKSVLSFTRAHGSFIYAFIFLAILATGIYFYNREYVQIKSQTASAERVEVQKVESKQAFQELKF